MGGTIFMLIHGFGGSPRELDYLAQCLQQSGFRTHSVTLAGHCCGRDGLRRSCHGDWLASAQTELERLAREYERVFLVGFSMGGLIALRLSSHPKVAAVTLINTPIFIGNPRILACDILGGGFARKYRKVSAVKGSANVFTVKSCVDFLRFLAVCRSSIKPAAVPVLIVQCSDDETVRCKSAKFLQERCGGNAVRRCYSGGRHLLLLAESPLRERVCRDIVAFARSV